MGRGGVSPGTGARGGAELPTHLDVVLEGKAVHDVRVHVLQEREGQVLEVGREVRLLQQRDLDLPVEGSLYAGPVQLRVALSEVGVAHRQQAAGDLDGVVPAIAARQFRPPLRSRAPGALTSWLPRRCAGCLYFFLVSPPFLPPRRPHVRTEVASVRHRRNAVDDGGGGGREAHAADVKVHGDLEGRVVAVLGDDVRVAGKQAGPWRGGRGRQSVAVLHPHDRRVSSRTIITGPALGAVHTLDLEAGNDAR